MNPSINPLLSVIMPVYNQDKYLAASIESILNQTFSDFELILIDDGSNDNSLAIMKKYASFDQRIRIVENVRNIGLTKSLNIGVQYARGKYIARQDGDDISYPDRMQKQYDFLEENSDISLVGVKYISVNLMTGERNCRNLPQKHTDILNWIESGTNPIANMIMVHKNIVLAVGGYNEKVKYAQDYALYHAISRKYKLANICEPLAEIRFHDENITVTKREEQRAYIMYVLENAVDQIPFDEFYPACMKLFEAREKFQSQIAELSKSCFHKQCAELLMLHKCEYKIERVPRAYYAGASALKVLGEEEKAKEIFEELLSLKYIDVSIKAGAAFHLGEIFFLSHNLKEAEKYFKQCLAINKNHKKAKEYIDNIKEKV